MVIGFLLMSIWIGFVILALAFVLGADTVGGEGLRQNIIKYFRSSSLIEVFYNFLPIAFATLRPWMPEGLPPEIFTFRL
jgi:hypothetical protein